MEFDIDIESLIVDEINSKVDIQDMTEDEIKCQVGDEIQSQDFDATIRDILSDIIDREVGGIAVAVHEQIENELKAIDIPAFILNQVRNANIDNKNVKDKLGELIANAPTDAAMVSWGALKEYFVRGINDVINTL